MKPVTGMIVTHPLLPLWIARRPQILEKKAGRSHQKPSVQHRSTE